MSIDIHAYIFISCEEAELINQELRDAYTMFLVKDFIIWRARELDPISYEIVCEDLGVDPAVKGSFTVSLNHKNQAHLIGDMVKILKNTYGSNIKLFLNGEKEL